MCSLFDMDPGPMGCLPFQPRLQTLKCTTTPENRSVQTVHRSNRSVQTDQRSLHRSNRSVQTVHRSVLRSNRSLQTVHRSVQSVPIVQSSPPFGTPSVSYYKSKFRLLDRERNIFYEYFCKAIKILRLIIEYTYMYMY
jgi:hypothetical protein